MPYLPYITLMPTEVITKPCEYCGEPILQTRNNKSEWPTIRFCDAKCRRVANRKGFFVEEEPEPTKIEVPNPHVNWRPKGKKHQPK